jgi:hypothetical protein
MNNPHDFMNDPTMTNRQRRAIIEKNKTPDYTDEEWAVIDMDEILQMCNDLLEGLKSDGGISEGCIKEHMSEFNYIMDLIYKTAFGINRRG